MQRFKNRNRIFCGSPHHVRRIEWQGLRIVILAMACAVLRVGPALSQAIPDALDSSDIRFVENKPSNVQLYWPDADQIDGKLLGWRDGRIQLDSQLFRSPVSVLADALETVRFTQRGGARADVGPHRLTLVDGSVLVGKFIATEEDSLRFVDDRFGELSFAITKVARIESNDSVGYAWDGELKPWLVQSGQWTIDAEQRLQTSQADSKLWLPLPLNESFAIEFEIVSQQSLDLVLATGQDPEKSYRLAKIGDSWIAGTSDDFEIVEALSDRQRQLILKLSRNAATGKLSLLQGEKILVEVTDNQGASDRSGILLHNLGHSLALKSLRVLEGQLSTTASELTKVTGSMKEPTPRSLDRLVFKDGSRLWCTVQDISDATLTIHIDLIGVAKRCSLQHIASIAPRAGTSSPSGQSDESDFRLQQGQSKLSGSCQFLMDPPNVLWHSAKLAQSVSLNMELPVSLHRQNGKAQTIQWAFQDSQVAFLNSGVTIPIRLEQANGAYTWLRTPFSASTVQVDNRVIRAIELWPRRTKPNFTKESREMLLSIPRNLEVDHYSHALIGQNGDLLRGNLVAVNEQSIEMDSRQEPLLVERLFVDTLLYLHPVIEADSKTNSKESRDTQNNVPSANGQSIVDQLSLQLSGGYAISGSWIGGDANVIRLKSAEMGECRVEMKSVQSFHFNLAPTVSSEGPLALDWKTKHMAQPRWQVAAPDQSSDTGRSLVGTAAPELSLPNSNGETVKLADHMGKVIVLDYWATWCGPCVASLPKYVEAAHKFDDNQVVFFGINSTETPEAVREFLQSKNWPAFDTLFDYDGAAARAMMVRGIPHTAVIGRDGKIAHVQIGYSPTGAEELYRVIEKLLN